ncbi:TPA: hypothetical protein ACOZ3K_004204 [Yersinia enterocolitica]
MNYIVKYKNTTLNGVKLLPPPHPLDGDSISYIYIFCDKEPEVSNQIKCLSEWEFIELNINNEVIKYKVDRYDTENNCIILVTDQLKIPANTLSQKT